jgi:hypothetical protein
MNASGPMSPTASVAELDGVVQRVAAAREVLGDDRDVAVDFHGRFTLANARRVAPLLEPYRPLFLEEPVVPENSHLIGEFVRSTSTPVSFPPAVTGKGCRAATNCPFSMATSREAPSAEPPTAPPQKGTP